MRRYGTRLGVASAWLDRLSSPWTTEGISNPTNPVWVPIFLRRSADFKPPADLASPLIMVRLHLVAPLGWRGCVDVFDCMC
jgi:NADPH-ferrihemoprotein reductase